MSLPPEMRPGNNVVYEAGKSPDHLPPLPQEAIKLLLDTHPHSIIHLEGERISYMNDAARTMFGTPDDPTKFRPAFDPGNPSGEIIAETIAGKQSTPSAHDIDWFRPDGTMFLTRTYVLPYAEQRTTLIVQDLSFPQEVRIGAHDLNNALSLIYGYAEIGALNNTLNEKNDALEEIGAAADQAAQIVRNLSQAAHKQYPQR